MYQEGEGFFNEQEQRLHIQRSVRQEKDPAEDQIQNKEYPYYICSMHCCRIDILYGKGQSLRKFPCQYVQT